MSNHGKGSNHFDGSDRQIVRAVAQSCGWELDRISDGQDVFYAEQYEQAELLVDYQAESLGGGLDIYRRQVKPGGCVESLEDVLDALRQPLRDAWADRIEAAHAAAERGL